MQSHDVYVQVLSDRHEGEASDLGRAYAELAIGEVTGKRHRAHLLILRGETTVTLRGNGRGGCNTEYLLSLY